MNSGSEVLREILIGQIKSATCFSVIAIETTDISGVEQLSLGVRYVHETEDSAVVKEFFLRFIPLKAQDVESITDAIVNALINHGFNLNLLVGLGYDGSSIMSGKHNGI